MLISIVAAQVHILISSELGSFPLSTPILTVIYFLDHGHSDWAYMVFICFSLIARDVKFFFQVYFDICMRTVDSTP